MKDAITMSKKLELPMGRNTVIFESIGFDEKTEKLLINFKGYYPLKLKPNDYQLSNLIEQLGIAFEDGEEITFEAINACSGKEVTYSRYVRTIEEELSGEELEKFEARYGNADFVQIVKKSDDVALIKKFFTNINFNLSTMPKEEE